MSGADEAATPIRRGLQEALGFELNMAKRLRDTADLDAEEFKDLKKVALARYQDGLAARHTAILERARNEEAAKAASVQLNDQGHSSDEDRHGLSSPSQLHPRRSAGRERGSGTSKGATGRSKGMGSTTNRRSKITGSKKLLTAHDEILLQKQLVSESTSLLWYECTSRCHCVLLTVCNAYATLMRRWLCLCPWPSIHASRKTLSMHAVSSPLFLIGTATHLWKVMTWMCPSNLATRSARATQSLEKRFSCGVCRLLMRLLSLNAWSVVTPRSLSGCFYLD